MLITNVVSYDVIKNLTSRFPVCEKSMRIMEQSSGDKGMNNSQNVHIKRLKKTLHYVYAYEKKRKYEKYASGDFLLVFVIIEEK